MGSESAKGAAASASALRRVGQQVRKTALPETMARLAIQPVARPWELDRSGPGWQAQPGGCNR